MKAQTLLNRVFDRLNIETGKDLHIHDERFYARVVRDQSLGLGEAYMDGWWDSDDLVALFSKILPGLPEVHKYLRRNFLNTVTTWLSSLGNRQRRSQARKDVQSHYDIGDELYDVMLDRNMSYSCAYFLDPYWTLDQAQEAKVDLIYQKLHLPEHATTPLKILDIGCGWGYGLKHGAVHYAIEGVGVTLSENQAKEGRRRTRGLPVEIRLQDYRDIPAQEKFDAIFSVGMFEHVGPRNYREFMRAAASHLKPKGLFLLHTIGSDISGPVDPWISKYIFPGGYIPSQGQIRRSARDLFIEQDVHEFGPFYGRTLEEWFERFDAGWHDLQDDRPEFYTERFYRMWKYYLLTCAASFYTGYNRLWQVVYSKQPLAQPYLKTRAPKWVTGAEEEFRPEHLLTA